MFVRDKAFTVNTQVFTEQQGYLYKT